MCYYQPNQPHCTCDFLQLVQPCTKAQYYPSPNHNPQPVVVACYNRFVLADIAPRYCQPCSTRPPRLVQMNQAQKRDMSHLDIENGLPTMCNPTVVVLPPLPAFANAPSSSRAPGRVEELQGSDQTVSGEDSVARRRRSSASRPVLLPAPPKSVPVTEQSKGARMEGAGTKRRLDDEITEEVPV